MSGGGGGGDKTEKPTAHRLSKAREQGQVAKSNDLNGALVMATTLYIMLAAGGYATGSLKAMVAHMTNSLAKLAQHDFSPSVFQAMFNGGIISLMLLMAPIVCSAMVMGVGSSVLQVRPLLTTKPLMPSFEKINPLAGFKRMFSGKAAMEVLKACLKMSLLGGVSFLILWNARDEFLALGLQGIQTPINLMLSVMGRIVFWCTAIYVALGVFDWWWQRHNLMKSLMMTKQEIRDEHKQMEGDPKMKSKIRQFGQRMLSKKMLASVPQADVLITNPTHFAIALQYDPDKAPAPRVIGKGQDHLAQKMKAAAKEHGVPMVENKPLARSLYAQVDVEHMVPPELFVAVAEVLAAVFAKKKGRRLRRSTTP